MYETINEAINTYCPYPSLAKLAFVKWQLGLIKKL